MEFIMPKKPMSKEEIEKNRGRILDTALDIIIKEGFDNLSVRKIASRMGFTATTIYNYYTNKDEINLMIRIRGFEKLYDLLLTSSASQNDLEDKLKAMIRGYIEFGLTNPSYYDIMFNLHTPKYLDYVGTDMESLAYTEKQISIRCLFLFVDLISSYLPSKRKKKEQFILFQVVKFWSDLHGVITLNNCRLFHEVLEDVNAFIEKRTEDMIQEIMFIKESLDEGKKLF
jgi:AcrR family transcriptional regulator